MAFAEGKVFGERLLVAGDLATLAVEIVGDGPAESRVGEPVGGVGDRRAIAAGDLVLALRTGFHPLEAVADPPLDRLVVAELEMQERMVLDRAPIAPVERVRADEVEGAG